MTAMTQPLDPHQVAATNPAVDTKKLEQALLIRQAMEKAGVFKKPEYRISPPLGTGPDKPAPPNVVVVRMTRAF